MLETRIGGWTYRQNEAGDELVIGCADGEVTLTGDNARTRLWLLEGPLSSDKLLMARELRKAYAHAKRQESTRP